MSNQRVLDKLLELSPTSESRIRLGAPLLVVRMYPAFEGERALSLHRSAAGEYVVRSVRLLESASERAAAEQRRSGGSEVSVSPDDGNRASPDDGNRALKNVRVPKHTAERQLDEPTANALLALWRAMLSRAQTVREVGAATGKSDGTIYSMSAGSTGAVTHSPRPGSLLALAVDSAELLFARVDQPSVNDDELLRSAQSLIQRALVRAQRRESCLMPYGGARPDSVSRRTSPRMRDGVLTPSN